MSLLSTPTSAGATAERDPYLSGDGSFTVDPYPAYDRLRREDPVHWSDIHGAWFLSRYADVVSALRDSRLSARRMPTLMSAFPPDDPRHALILERASSQMINSDPPEHPRRRALVAGAFLPRRVEALRPRARQVARNLIAQARDHGSMDAIADFAYPLPMTVIAELMGIPAGDRDQLKRWAEGVAGFMSGGGVSESEIDAYLGSWGALAEYVRTLAAERRGGPGVDLVSELVARWDAGEATEAEVVSNLVLLAVAGHETTTNTLGMGLLALIRNPDQLARLRTDQSLVAPAVEEILRYEATSQRNMRVAAAGLEFAGRRVRSGQLVVLLLGAANRDPAEFPEPHRFDIARSPNRHVTFSHGPHFCLGAQLARMELQEAILAVLELDALELADPGPVWKPNVRMRGLAQLPLRFAAG